MSDNNEVVESNQPVPVVPEDEAPVAVVPDMEVFDENGVDQPGLHPEDVNATYKR